MLGGTLPPPEVFGTPEEGLTHRERETASGLRRLDPHLAGLYERGLAMARQIDYPGNVYLLAHAGRELSNGVLELLLSDEGLEVSEADLERAAQKENHRSRIAKALGLEPNDPRVDVWFRLHREFPDACHWRSDGPQSLTVRDAFERFASLLYGLVARYYDTEADLDGLLATDAPTREHTKRLLDLQLRLGQRNYFFGRLTNPAWVRHLVDEGFFNSPPTRITYADGSWRAKPWPEGEYLLSVASREPAAVGDVLNSIPLTNNNPLVWDVVAKAGRELPPDVAASLVPSLCEAIKTVPWPRLTESVSDLVIFLAEAGQKEAFELASFLLRVADPSEVEKVVEKVEGFPDRLPAESVFPCFVGYDQQELLARVVGALEASDARRALQLLLDKVRRLHRLAEDTQSDLGLQRVDLQIESMPNRHDIVALIINATVGVGQRLAAQGRGEATWVLGQMDDYEADIATRIGYLVLAECGQHMQERLDDLLGSNVLREPGFPATEVAALLRSQFSNASPEARRDYVAAVEAGPNRETATMRQPGVSRDPTPEEIDNRIRRYQRRILTFFRGDIPKEFHDLAERLGLLGATPSHEEKQLAEVGVYGGVIAGGGPDESPISAKELARSSPDEIVALLVGRDWEESGVADAEGDPGALALFEGWVSEKDFVSEKVLVSLALCDTLSGYAAANAMKALEVLDGALEQGAAPSLLEAVLNGVCEADVAGSALDWELVLDVGRSVLNRTKSLDISTDPHVRSWRSTAGHAVRLLGLGCARDSVPHEYAGSVWDVLTGVAHVPAIWDVAYSRDLSLESVVSAKDNDAVGNIVEATILAALWDYRYRVDDQQEAQSETKATARRAVHKRLEPMLDHWLQDDGPNAPVTRAAMGHYLPWLHLLVPKWIKDHAAYLLDRGLEEPASWPTWTTYVSHEMLYGDVFRTMRPWYLKAAKGSDVWREAAGEFVPSREVTGRYATHLIVAVVRGWLNVGDDDKLLETACDHVAPSDWSRAYGAIRRRWSEADARVPPDFVQRLVKFWEWRVSHLAQQPESTTKVEEAKELSWIFHTPYIPDTDRVRLGIKIAELAQGQFQMLGWEEMLPLAEIDPDGTRQITETVLLAELRSDHPYIPVEEVRPLLARIISEGNPDTRARVGDLINRLGERGYRQFKDLLDGIKDAIREEQ